MKAFGQSKAYTETISVLCQLKKKIVDVATLQHYAEDAGKSKEAIAAITEPQEMLTFEAEGVIIK